MKPRSVLLIVGVLLVLGIGGYVASRSPWVMSLFGKDTASAEEQARAAAAALKNDAPPDAASGSPEWRGAARKGVAPDQPFRTDWDKNPPKEQWRAAVGGGYGSCAVAGGKVYLQDKHGDGERVLCLDAESGKPVWEFAYASGPAGNDPSFAIGPRATPTVVGNWVYAVGGAGLVHALEVVEGKPQLRWKHDLQAEFGAPMPQWGFAGSPLVHNGLAIVMPGAKGAAVLAFDAKSGDTKWKSGSHPPGYSSAVVAPVGGQDTVFAFVGDALLAVRPTDGTITDTFKFETQFGGNIATPVVVDNEYVFISASYGSGCALVRAEKSGDAVKLKPVYSRRRSGFQAHIATPVYKDKHLFGIDGLRGGNGLKCIDLATGAPVEDWEERKIGQGALILAGEYLIVQRDAGELCLVRADPKECKVVARVPGVLTGKNNWATPALVGGRLFLRDEEKVVCLDVRP
jgi:outer membrane protein assembly factor BamB